MRTDFTSSSRALWLPLTLTATALALLSSPAYADESRVEAHDGFMIRLGLGFGLTKATFEEPNVPELELDATGGDTAHLSIAFGYAVIENLIVHAEIFGGGMTNPNVTLGGEDFGNLNNTQLVLSGVGIGATYYIMPYNVYVSGTIGTANVGLEVDGETRELEDASGSGLSFMVGKEWWVSDNWGLGAALQYYRMNVTYANDGEMNASSVGLLFSATYN